jgi:hypothetical protein
MLVHRVFKRNKLFPVVPNKAAGGVGRIRISLGKLLGRGASNT